MLRKTAELFASGFASIWGKLLYAASALATILSVITFFYLTEIPTPKLSAGVSLSSDLSQDGSFADVSNAAMNQFGKQFSELSDDERIQLDLPSRLLSFIFFSENSGTVPILNFGAAMSIFFKDQEVYHDYYEIRFSLQPGEKRSGEVRIPPEIEDFDRVAFCADYPAKYPWLYHQYEVSYEFRKKLAFVSSRLLRENLKTKLWFQRSKCNYTSSHGN